MVAWVFLMSCKYSKETSKIYLLLLKNLKAAIPQPESPSFIELQKYKNLIESKLNSLDILRAVLKRIWRVAERRILLKNFISPYTFQTIRDLLYISFTLANPSTNALA